MESSRFCKIAIFDEVKITGGQFAGASGWVECRLVCPSGSILYVVNQNAYFIGKAKRWTGKRDTLDVDYDCDSQEFALGHSRYVVAIQDLEKIKKVGEFHGQDSS